MRLALLTANIFLVVNGLTTSGYSDVSFKPQGVIIDSIGEGSALEKAGLRPGDVLLLWEYSSGSKTKSEVSRGAIDSFFDWIGFVTERAPRGRIRLTGRRHDSTVWFDIPLGKWDVRIRPNTPHLDLESFVSITEEPEEKLYQRAAILGRIASDQPLECWANLRLAEALVSRKQWNSARLVLSDSLFSAINPLCISLTWEAIGSLYERQSQFDEAEQAYSRALASRAKMADKNLSYAQALTYLGELYRRQDKFAHANRILRKALTIRTALAPDSLETAGSLNNVALLEWAQDHLERASTHILQALKISEELAPRSIDTAAMLNTLGAIEYQKEDLSAAMEHFTTAMRIYKDVAPKSKGLFGALSNLGATFMKEGNLALADQYLFEAFKLAESISPNSLDIADSLTNLGILAWQRGDLEVAIDRHQSALKIYRHLIPNSLAMAGCLDNLALVFRNRGELIDAEVALKESLHIRETLSHDSIDVARSLANLGSIALSRHDYTVASAYFEKANTILDRRTSNNLLLATVASNMAQLELDFGRPLEAERHIHRSLEIQAAVAPESLDVALALNLEGEIELRLGKFASAHEHQKRALKIQEQLAPGSLSLAQTLRLLGVIELRTHRLTNAIGYFERSIRVLEQQIGMLGGSQNSKGEFRAQYHQYYQDLLESLLLKTSNEEAFQILELSRGKSFLAMLAERDLNFSADSPRDLENARRRLAVERESLSLAMAKANPRSEHGKLDRLAAQLRSVEREHDRIEAKILRASPRLSSLRHPQSLGYNEAQAVLEAGSVALSYSVGSENTFLFVIKKEEPLRVITIEIGEQELRREIGAFRKLIADASGTGNWNTAHSRILADAAANLYCALIKPAQKYIKDSARLLIIPDGPLHLLPWGALTVESDGNEQNRGTHLYLAAWKPIYTTLSFTVYKEQHTKKALLQPQLPHEGLLYAMFGDPVYLQRVGTADTESIQDVRIRGAAQRGFDFKPLPMTRSEVEQIKALFPERVQLFVGRQATEDAVKSLPRNIRIVHFAAHAILDERFPLNSAVVLSIPEKFEEGKENGLLQAWEIFEQIRLDADLVVLSACESGLGKEMGGEGLIGLTRAFQYAGARSVMASLWKISDRTTAELMVRFYKHLKEGLPKDEALRAAQMELIRGPIQMKNEKGEVEEIDASAPYYWAAFQIYGDWQ